MADKRTGPADVPRRGKRAAPTIDLTAADMTPAPTPEPQAVTSEPPPAPPQEPPQPDAGATGGEPRKPGFFSGPTLAAGIAGAAMTAILLFALWLTGLVPIRYAGSTTMRARVAALEMQIHDLQNRPAVAPEGKTVDALGQRVGKIEETLTKLPAGDTGLSERVAAADNAMKALGLALTALNRRSDDTVMTANQARERAEAAEKAVAELRVSVQEAARNSGPGISQGELDVLQKRLAALETSAQAARDAIAKSTAADNATRLAVAAAALRDAAESGAPFSAELAQAQSLGADEKSLAPLAAFAASGVPSAPALAQELRTLLPILAKAVDVQPSGNFFERLQANAGKLLPRPVGASAGDNASAVLARLEIDVAKADLTVAVADLAKLNTLPEASRASVQAWTEKAKMRDAALAAARKFAADAARALGAR